MLSVNRSTASRAVFECEPSESHYNPIGTVHGGVISTLLDSALSCAVHTTLPAGTGYTTAELTVNFVRPVVAATGRLRAEGQVIHVGSRLATAEARLTDAAGTLSISSRDSSGRRSSRRRRCPRR